MKPRKPCAACKAHISGHEQFALDVTADLERTRTENRNLVNLHAQAVERWMVAERLLDSFAKLVALAVDARGGGR